MFPIGINWHCTYNWQYPALCGVRKLVLSFSNMGKLSPRSVNKSKTATQQCSFQWLCWARGGAIYKNKEMAVSIPSSHCYLLSLRYLHGVTPFPFWELKL